jgi:hypothetical protein
MAGCDVVNDNYFARNVSRADGSAGWSRPAGALPMSPSQQSFVTEEVDEPCLLSNEAAPFALGSDAVARLKPKLMMYPEQCVHNWAALWEELLVFGFHECRKALTLGINDEGEWMRCKGHGEGGKVSFHYQVCVFDHTTSHKWTVDRRYRDFRNFALKLARVLEGTHAEGSAGVADLMTGFPRRFPAGLSCVHDYIAASRKAGLTQFLGKVLALVIPGTLPPRESQAVAHLLGKFLRVKAQAWEMNQRAFEVLRESRRRVYSAIKDSHVGIHQFWQHLNEVDRVAQVLWQFCHHWRQYVRVSTGGIHSPGPVQFPERPSCHRSNSTIGAVPTMHEPFWGNAQARTTEDAATERGTGRYGMGESVHGWELGRFASQIRSNIIREYFSMNGRYSLLQQSAVTIPSNSGFWTDALIDRFYERVETYLFENLFERFISTPRFKTFVHLRRYTIILCPPLRPPPLFSAPFFFLGPCWAQSSL